jgi:hypothetical protein
MNKLDQALKNLKAYIVSISDLQPFSKGFTPEIFFSSADDGVLFLDGEDARRYVVCLKGIVEIATADDQISSKTVEKLVQKAILAALDINNHRRECSFDSRVEKAIKELNVSLQRKPVGTRVYFPVAGLSKEGLPFKFGNVIFSEFDSDNIQQFQDVLEKQVFPLEEKVPRQILVGDIEKASIGKVFGIVNIKAKDDEAARNSAQREMRLAIDAVNFFSDLIPYSSGYLYLPGDVERVVITIPSLSDALSIGYSQQLVGPVSPVSIVALQNTDREKSLGVSKIGKLLTERLNALGEKLLSSIQWAGRATVESRNEESFLLYAIALESLILLENDREELTYRLRTRVAHLLGKNFEAREKISKQVRDLYITTLFLCKQTAYLFFSANRSGF